MRWMLRRHSCSSKSGVVQPARKGVDDLAPVRPRAARAAHGQDEREAELGVVVGIELLDARKLLGRAVGQAGLASARWWIRRSALARPWPCPPARGGRGSAPAACRVPASRTTCTITCFRWASERNGRCASAAWVAIQGECSYRPSSMRGGLVGEARVELFQCQCHGFRLLAGKGGPASSGARCRCGGRPRRGHGPGHGPGTAAAPRMRPGGPAAGSACRCSASWVRRRRAGRPRRTARRSCPQVGVEVIALRESPGAARSACRWCPACRARSAAAPRAAVGLAHLHPERQVVAVVVAVVLEAAVVGHQAAGVGAVAPGVPAQRRSPVSWLMISMPMRMCSRSVASSTAW
jgi:hypothetical protein